MRGMERPLTVLVIGATGHQGGAVARALLERGHRVRAFTRNPRSNRSMELEEKGCMTCEGDLEEIPTLVRAAKGVDAVFAMATPWEAGTDTEIRCATNVVKAAKEARVDHLVYSSIAGADRETGIPHFDSKWQVERFIRSAGVPYTVVAPVLFMENLLSRNRFPGLRNGKLEMAMRPTRSMQQVAVEDIGRFVALVMDRRDEFLGRRVEVASDELDGVRMAEAISKASGQTVMFVGTPVRDLLETDEDQGLMHDWLDRVGHMVDLRALRERYPEVGWHSFEEWAKEQDWSFIESVVMTA